MTVTAKTVANQIPRSSSTTRGKDEHCMRADISAEAKADDSMDPDCLAQSGQDARAPTPGWQGDTDQVRGRS